jgi:hypothetical protein
VVGAEVPLGDGEEVVEAGPSRRQCQRPVSRCRHRAPSVSSERDGPPGFALGTFYGRDSKNLPSSARQHGEKNPDYDKEGKAHDPGPVHVPYLVARLMPRCTVRRRATVGRRKRTICIWAFQVAFRSGRVANFARPNTRFSKADAAFARHDHSSNHAAGDGIAAGCLASSSSSSSSFSGCSFANSTNITGTRKSDKKVEDISPPTTVSANG